MKLFGKEPHPLDDKVVMDLAQTLLDVKTWPAMRAILERHAVVLSPRGPRTLRALVEVCVERGEHVMTRSFLQLTELLERCRLIGVAAAIEEAQRCRPGPGPLPDEQMLKLMTSLFFQPTLLDKERLLDRHPALYGAAGLELLKDLVAMFSDMGDVEQARDAAVHGALLTRCGAVGVPVAFAEFRRVTAS